MLVTNCLQLFLVIYSEYKLFGDLQGRARPTPQRRLDSLSVAREPVLIVYMHGFCVVISWDY